MAGSVRAADGLGYEKAALLCLASISAGPANITKAAREAKGIVAIDACAVWHDNERAYSRRLLYPATYISNR